MISATFPRSLRQGQTTETEVLRRGWERGRATTQYVRQKWLNGHTFATNPLRRRLRSGTCFGNSMRRVSVTISKSVSESRLRMTSGEIQFLIGFLGLSRRSSASRMTGFHRRL